MELIKLKDKRNGAIIEVKKTLASDYIGTGRFEMYVEKKPEPKVEIKSKYKPFTKEED